MQQRTRIKICGLTRVDDVHAAVRAGADAIGLVFYPDSARAVSVAQARVLRDAVPAMMSVVALFVNATRREVQEVIEHVQPDLLQFHGDETPEYCESFGRRYMRAFRVGAPGLDAAAALVRACARYGSASGWLFDSYSAGYGGSGLSFDADLLHGIQQSPDSRAIVLAGGLTVNNVADRVKAVRPYAIDVSSGVEIEPGIKSPAKMAAFVAALRDL